MSENIITHSASAAAVVTMVKNQIRNEKGKYAAYVKENGVTADNVGEHVKALRLLAYPGAKASDPDPKRFADKVRNGLRHTIGDSPADRANGTENLLTRTGLDALAGKTEAEIVAAVLAEIANRSK